jgi:transposase
MSRKGKEGSPMKKVQEYVVKGKAIFIGLEDSKKTWKVCVRSEGMIVQEVSMPAKYENLRNYLKSRYPSCKIKLIYEAGFGGFWLHDRLEEDGVDCIVTPPNKVTEEKANKVKTDRVDARRLSKNLENNDYKSCHVPDQELREDRQISRTLVQIQKDIIRTKNRIRKFLDFHGLNELVGEFRWGALNHKNLREIRLGESLRFSLNVHLDELDQLLSYRKQLKKRLMNLTKKERYCDTYRYFESSPGIGWLTAIRLVLEWGEDLSRFQTGRQFSSFVGITPSEYSSGKFVRKGHITRQSHEFVRSWLIQCSWVSIKRDPVLLKKFQDVWRNTGSKKKAIVAVARKLSVRLWHLATYKETYETGLLEEQRVAA